MKKIKLFGLLFVSLFAFCSNGSNDEQLRKEIVGTWSYSVTEEDEEEGIITIISINGTTAFHKNNVCEIDAVIIITDIDEDGYKTKIKYKMEAYGKYEIQKSYIVYDFGLKNIGIKLLHSDDSDMSDLYNEHFIPQLKHEMLVNNREKILELTEKLMKTETEVEGEKDSAIYVRQSK